MFSVSEPSKVVIRGLTALVHQRLPSRRAPMVAPFLNCNLVIVGHAHRQLTGMIAKGALCFEFVAQLAQPAKIGPHAFRLRQKTVAAVIRPDRRNLGTFTQYCNQIPDAIFLNSGLGGLMAQIDLDQHRQFRSIRAPHKCDSVVSRGRQNPANECNRTIRLRRRALFDCRVANQMPARCWSGRPREFWTRLPVRDSRQNYPNRRRSPRAQLRQDVVLLTATKVISSGDRSLPAALPPGYRRAPLQRVRSNSTPP